MAKLHDSDGSLNLEFVMVLVTMVVVLYMLFVQLGIKVKLERAGYDSGATLRYESVRDDWGTTSAPVTSAFSTEAPVFWNAGSYGLVAADQQSAVRGESTGREMTAAELQATAAQIDAARAAKSGMSVRPAYAKVSTSGFEGDKLAVALGGGH